MYADWFCLKGVYRESNFRRRLTKLKPNDSFSDFAVYWDPINEIDPDFFYFKVMDQKLTPSPIGPDDTKCTEVGAE